MAEARKGSFWDRALGKDFPSPQATPSDEPDWAEMGTAFGLDATFVDPAVAAALQAAADRRLHDGDSNPALGASASSPFDGIWATNRLNGRSVI